MKRVVQPELLDALPVDDPGAVRSRADLRRLNRWLRHARLIASNLLANLAPPPETLVEVGAGDGTLLLEVARQLRGSWPAVRVILVDAKPTTRVETLAEFESLGWRAERVVADVFDWVAESDCAVDGVLANLFLHHLDDRRLGALLHWVARHARVMVACETRREWPSLAVVRMLGILGCHRVTRHDARTSMKAGFVDGELARLWPGTGRWDLRERRVRWLTHLFVARKLEHRG
jgi:hypothetical protein